MTSYKQWSGPTREARFAEYKRARAAGEIPPPGTCEICTQAVGTMHHAEDYGPTREAYFASLHSLCGRCHAWLHLRFRFPGRWRQYLYERFLDGPLPPVRNMGEIYYGTRGMRDIPIPDWPHGSQWWEKLTTERYTGPLL